MAISFDKLPDKLPNGNFALIPDGHYKATIEKAEMRQPKDLNRPPYLSLTWNVFNEKDKPIGKIFDIIAESSSEYVLYKLRCFVQAIDVNLGKTFELKDLTKVSVGKTCMISVTTDENSEPPKNQINIFSNAPYARYEETTASENDNFPFETPDQEPDRVATKTSRESY